MYLTMQCDSKSLETVLKKTSITVNLVHVRLQLLSNIVAVKAAMGLNWWSVISALVYRKAWVKCSMRVNTNGVQCTTRTHKRLF